MPGHDADDIRQLIVHGVPFACSFLPARNEVMALAIGITASGEKQRV